MTGVHTVNIAFVCFTRLALSRRQQGLAFDFFFSPVKESDKKEIFYYEGQ